MSETEKKKEDDQDQQEHAHEVAHNEDCHSVHSAHSDPDIDDFDTEEGKITFTYRITEKMAYHPIKISCCMFLSILVIVMITAALNITGVSEASEYDWVIADTEESENLDALDDAINRADSVTLTVLERSDVHEFKFFYLFESNDGTDIYTAANLYDMCLIESSMLQAGGFDDVCQLTDGNCTLPVTSIVVYFYDFKAISDWNCTLLSDAYVSDMKEPIYDALATPAGQEQYGIWLSDDAAELGYSVRCDSIWHFGTPLPGYATESDRKEDQFKEYQKFLAALDGSVEGVEAELFDFFSIDDNADGVFAYYPTPYMSTAEVATLRIYWFSFFNLQNEFIRMFTKLICILLFFLCSLWSFG